MKFRLLSRLIAAHSHFRFSKSPLNSQQFKEFVHSGGTRNIRMIHSLCLKTRLASNLPKVPKRFNTYGLQLENFFVQRCVSYVFDSKFVETYALSKINGRSGIHPIPPEWFQILESSGFKINKFLSKFLWKLSLYKKGSKSSVKILQQLLNFRAHEFTIDQLKGTSQISAWSNSIDKNYFQSDKVNLYTFKNWLDMKSPISGKLITLHDAHFPSKKASDNSIDQSFQVGSIQILRGLRSQYFTDLLAILLFGTMQSILGKPEFLSIGHDLALALRVQASDKQQLPDYIFFTESDGIIKPLWANAAEERGANVVVIFFSACDSPMLRSEVSPSFEIYKCSSWQKFWVVDETQRALLESKIGIGNAEYTVVGFPWRTDERIHTVTPSKKLIAIFDYENIEGFYTFSTLNDVGYCGSEKEIRFLNDILDISQSFDLEILHKPKREISSNRRSQSYRETLIRLEEKSSYRRISADVSPNQLIEMADYVISLPVTSTAIIAKYAGKNSIYYDPVGLLDPSDICLRDVLLVQSRESLKKWFQFNFSNYEH
jgi:polysaccharide biosynthesis PFTS motif protein